MKKLMWILAILSFSNQASALNVQDFQTLMKQKIKAHSILPLDTATPPSPAPAVPIRQAKMRYKVSKGTFSKGADGNYNVNTTEICSGLSTINVYDHRGSANPNFQLGDFSAMTCPTIYLGNPIDLKIGGMLFLETDILFDVAQDFKVGLPLLWFEGSKSGPPVSVPDMSTTTLFNSDLNSHSMLGLLRPTLQWNCTNDSTGNSNCAPPTMEFFSAIVDLQD